jgi:hypothetical protein
VTIPEASYQSIHLSLVAVLLPYPHPEAPVEVPSALEFFGFPLGLVSEIQIIVGHLKDGLPIGLFICRPDIIRMIVRCDIDPFLLSQDRSRTA